MESESWHLIFLNVEIYSRHSECNLGGRWAGEREPRAQIHSKTISHGRARHRFQLGPVIIGIGLFVCFYDCWPRVCLPSLPRIKGTLLECAQISQCDRAQLSSAVGGYRRRAARTMAERAH